MSAQNRKSTFGGLVFLTNLPRGSACVPLCELATICTECTECTPTTPPPPRSSAKTCPGHIFLAADFSPGLQSIKKLAPRREGQGFGCKRGCQPRLSGVQNSTWSLHSMILLQAGLSQNDGRPKVVGIWFRFEINQQQVCH